MFPKQRFYFSLLLMVRPNTQSISMRGGANPTWYGRLGAGRWRSDYFLVLYINGEKTRVKVPVRGTDGLKERVIKMNMERYFYKSDTERVGR